MKKIGNILNKLLDYLLELLLIIIVVVVAVGVVFRYFLNNSLFWTQELTCYLLVYLVLLGSAKALGNGRHICMSISTKKINKYIVKLINIISTIVIVSFCIFMIIEGIRLSSNNMSSHTGILPIPTGILYLAAPISGFFSLIIYICSLHDKEPKGNK